jgi:SAM-dependent methyltransferase
MTAIICSFLLAIPLTSWEKPAPEQNVYEEQGQRVLSDPVEDYRLLVEVFDWDEIFQTEEKNPEITLLEIGCGTGRWLDTVQYELFGGGEPQRKWKKVACDLLDPSEVAMSEASKKILPPWQVGKKIKTTLENAELEKERYDLIWSTHAFYAIPKQSLSNAFKKMQTSLKPKGKMIIAHSSESSFYIQCYEAFRKAFPQQGKQPYTTAEDIMTALAQADIPYRLDILSYEENIHKSDEQTLDHFISNECIEYSYNRDLDHPSDITMYDFLSTAKGKSIISRYSKHDGYIFPQKVYIFTVTKD